MPATTSLGMNGPSSGGRFTKRRFNDYTASAISETVARANYADKILSDSKLQRLRKYVFKMVSGWMLEDKKRILAEYGALTGSMKDDELNKRLVETLIINLREEDLDLLMRDIISDESKMIKEVTRIRNDRKRVASKFTARSFSEVAQATAGAKNPKEIRKYLEQYDKAFKIPKGLLSRMGGLKRELQTALKEIYSKQADLVSLASRMGVNVFEDMKKTELERSIINKTIMYYDLIVGSVGKKRISATIIDSAPYEELIGYTSFAQDLGLSVSSSQIDAKRKAAAVSRTSLRRSEQTSYGRLQYGLFGNRTEELGVTKAAKAVGGGIKSVVKGAAGLVNPIGYARRAASLAIGGVAGFFKGDIMGTVGKVDDWLKNPFTYKSRMEQKQLKETFNKAKKEVNEMSEKGTLDQFLSDSNIDPNDFNKLTSTAMSFGLRVGDYTNFEVLKKQIATRLIQQKIYKDKLAASVKKAEGSKGILGLFAKRGLVKKRAELAALEKASEQPTEGSAIPYVIKEKGGSYLIKTNKAVPVYIVGGRIGPSASASGSSGKDKDDGDPMYVNMNAPSDVTRVKGKYAMRVFDTTQLLMQKYALDKRIKDKKKDDMFFDISNSIGASIKDSGINKLKKEPVTPVYITNKAVPTDVLAVFKAIAGFIPVIGGPLKKALESATNSSGGTISAMLDMVSPFAKGGSGKATSATSQFISGDSRLSRPGRENKELVNINWKKQEYAVKPIPSVPKFADGGSKTLSGKVKRMTESDRIAPMSVGISSNLVSYSRTLQGVSDDGNKQALKVYTVNPGIMDMVEVAGVTTSLIALVADVAQRLTSIEGLMSVNNQQNNASLAVSNRMVATMAKGGSGGNPFAGGSFPTGLDTILKGT
jgi:hypothetical protein